MSHPIASPEELYGVLGEYASGEALVEAVRQARAAGYQRIDAFTPMPVEGLAEALGFRRTGLPAVVLAGGIVGGLIGYGFQYWAMAIDYPLNVGGRPLNSWPAFMPITFEMTVLVAALFGVLGMLALNGLPRPHHPLFAVPEFARATRDRFFLSIESRDPKFKADEARRQLFQTGASEVFDVPR